MKNPKILFIAPSSYPIYGPEANVNAKVLKVLTDGGCVIDLIGRTPRANISFYPTSDTELFVKNINSINLVHVNTTEDIKTIFRHLKTLLKTGYIYKGADWSVEAIKKSEELISKRHYDFIYTYDYPSEIVGLFLTKKYGIKWVPTWNDPYMWKKYPAPYGQGVNFKAGYFREKLIADIGKYAFRNVFPSTRLRDYMLQYMTNMKVESCVISPHIVLDELVKPNEKEIGDTLKIIHTGALGRERDPKTLLQAIRIFVDQKPDAKIEFSFLGIFQQDRGDYFSNLIDQYGVEKYIKRIPPVTYKECLDFVRDYDICMLIEAACEIGIFLPSKIADYIQNNKPVFAISPSIGLICDMYQNGEIEYFADVTNPKTIVQELNKIYADFEKKRLAKTKQKFIQFRKYAILNTHKREIFE